LILNPSLKAEVIVRIGGTSNKYTSFFFIPDFKLVDVKSIRVILKQMRPVFINPSL